MSSYMCKNHEDDITNILKQVGGAADACGPTCETDSMVRFSLQNCNIILSKKFIVAGTVQDD